ncbi:hypothetical protein HRI_003500900 [Hibiscus trionum]|uniref:Uncharacterized protein n=1 Tax=Hibiscus trionum TaxID=183268 RepID=A0A9W7MF65_HIBTR|nr:hypothetical protein HRI_003500900 [Hibiscus trionum]
MVLGVAWLATLGPVIMDFSKLTWAFHLYNTHHRWQGDIDTGPQLVEIQTLRKLREMGSVACFYKLQLGSSTDHEERVERVDMQKVFQEFAGVFEPSSNLPPPRATNHSISLVSNAKLLSVCPYRYPHF